MQTMRCVLALALVAAASVPTRAQDARGLSRLDPPTRAAVLSVLDSARAQGLPTEPLMEKVYEAVVKGADGPRIILAVRSLSQEMARAHRALGTVATADELKAAASAMHAGVPAVELGKMKKETGGLRRKLTLPFTVLADLVSRGVPVGTAANAIRSLVGAGARDADINTFQQKVASDIDNGAPPAAAAETRVKGAVSTGKPELEQL